MKLRELMAILQPLMETDPDLEVVAEVEVASTVKVMEVDGAGKGFRILTEVDPDFRIREFETLGNPLSDDERQIVEEAGLTEADDLEAVVLIGISQYGY